MWLKWSQAENKWLLQCDKCLYASLTIENEICLVWCVCFHFFFLCYSFCPIYTRTKQCKKKEKYGMELFVVTIYLSVGRVESPPLIEESVEFIRRLTPYGRMNRIYRLNGWWCGARASYFQFDRFENENDIEQPK